MVCVCLSILMKLKEMARKPLTFHLYIKYTTHSKHTKLLFITQVTETIERHREMQVKGKVIDCLVERQ